MPQDRPGTFDYVEILVPVNSSFTDSQMGALVLRELASGKPVLVRETADPDLAPWAADNENNWNRVDHENKP